MEQEYKYNKSRDFAETVNYYAWWRLRLLIERISGCPMCSPGRGCNRRNKRRERCWKSQRINQYKTVDK